ncbi:hypothetical protein BD626DRAFT_498158 [Schizophyllum amplum]|uniref:Endothelin-converting enzyme 1 n=1 Tax=Schizophyllum amplum TaxID=97359 RepID=A0A550CDD6_9AGAR|nr:hypothetical protein BD626DRAFT_498158 [Auriculariopsis ampla]
MADDQERTPLLRDPEAEDDYSEPQEEQPSFLDRVGAVVQEPLTDLSKVLLVVCLIFLLLSSVFIGLFAGTQQKLNKERGRNDTSPVITATMTATYVPGPSTIVTTTTASAPGPTQPPEEAQCLTPECIMLSASILSSLDTSQDPCENFYEFANNGWLDAHPLPADKGSFGTFEELARKNQHVIQKILESNSTSLNTHAQSYDEQILKKIRGMYDSCMDESGLDKIGLKPLSDFVAQLKKVYNKGSTDSRVPSEKLGLTAALALLHSRGVNALFDFSIDGDVGVDPNNMVLWFSQAGLGLPSKEYYGEKSIMKAYRSTVEQLLFTLLEAEEKESSEKPEAAVIMPEPNTEFAVNDDTKDNVWPPWPWPPWGDDDDGHGDDGDDSKKNSSEIAHKLAKKVLKFERKLAKISLDLDLLYGDPIGTYNPAPISNLTEGLPQVDFPAYFSSFAPRAFPDRVIITYPAYIEALCELLKSTSPQVIEAYLVVRAAHELSPYLGLGTDAWKAQRSLQETLSGLKKGAVGDRKEYCVHQVEETLGFAAGRYFVNEVFGGDSREKGTKVITDIVKAFQDSLGKVDWMDAPSAIAAAEKAEAIRVKVGYPLSPNTEEPASIASWYRAVNIDEDGFFGNVLSSRANDQIHQWLQLGKQRDMDAWEMYPSMVNAYFNPPANEIVFPAGILQPPFFSHDWPSYLAYGAFGHVAAHELTHAFDSSGRLYNQEGKLEQWWTNETSAGFDRKQECIVKQYAEYTIDDGKGGKVHVNGNLTSGENIGDTGLVQAYRAWTAQYTDSFQAGNEYLLPGLNFSREQLFFIAFARSWARAMTPAAAVQRIRTDPHSPNMWRVQGTVFNIPEFAEAFKCPKNSTLNPPMEKRCIFWS